MAKPPLPDKVIEKLEQPDPATITTLRPDGTPVSVATWYLLDGDRVLVDMDHSRKRLQHLRDSPRVSAWIEIHRWHGWGATRQD